MFLLFVVFILSLHDHSCNAELKGVVIVMRHGVRSPNILFSVGGYNNGSYWPDGLGQLTKEGKLGIYELGKKIRARYSNFIEPHSSPISKDITALSTNVTRTLESAEILLSSLYPPNEKQQWNSELNWIPIPIIILDVTTCIKCPRYAPLSQSSFQEWAKNSLLTEFREEISKNDLKKEVSDVRKEALLLEQVFIQDYVGLPLPDWLKLNKTELFKLFHKVRMINVSNKTLVRMCSGSLIREILSKLEQIVHGRNSSKIYFYSGHDDNILGLLYTFGIPTEKNPGFGSTFIIEVHEYENGTNQIKVIFSQDASFLQEEKEISNCGKVCTFDNLTKMLKPFIPENWKEECGENKFEKSSAVIYVANYCFLSISALLSIIIFFN